MRAKGGRGSRGSTLLASFLCCVYHGASFLICVYLGARCGHPWTHLNTDLKAKGSDLCDLGLHLGTLGLHLGTHGVHVPILFQLWGGALEPLGHLSEKASKKVPKSREMETQIGHIVDDILSFGGK